MNRAVGYFVVCALFAGVTTVFAEDAKPSNCAEDLEVMKLVYATSRGNAESYLETLARTDIKLKAIQAQLAEANQKIKAFEETKSKE